MLRRLLMTLLCLVLLPLAAAQAESLPWAPQDFTAWEDALYALTAGGVYRQEQDGWALIPTGAAQEDSSDAILRICAAPQGLFSLSASYPEDGSEGLLSILCRPWEGGAGEKWLLPELPGMWTQVQGFLVEDETAYLLYHRLDGDAPWGMNTLRRISLTGGGAEDLLTDRITDLTLAPDGRLLALRRESEDAIPQIVSIDPASCAVTVLFDAPGPGCAGLACDPQTGDLLLCEGTALYRFREGEASPVRAGYLLPTGSDRRDQPACLYDGRYYIADWAAPGQPLLSCTADPALLPEVTLRVTDGWTMRDAICDFAAQTGIAVEYTAASPWQAADVAAHMATPDAADVYLLFTDGGLTELMDLGLLAPLSGETRRSVDAMYPRLTRPLYLGGELYALPADMSVSQEGYNPAVLAELGLTQADLPHSLEGFIDFLRAWETQRSAHPHILPVDSPFALEEVLLTRAILRHLHAAEAAGGSLSFDTPAFRALLQAIEDASESLQAIALSGVGYDFTAPALFSLYASPLPASVRAETRFLPLTLTGEGEPVVAATLGVFAIRATSDQADAAQQLLAYLAQRLSQPLHAALIPGADDPIEAEDYRAVRDALQESIAYYSTMPDMAVVVDELRAELEAHEQARYAFTAEDFAAYRALAPSVTISTVFPALSAQDAVSRYLQREISAEQLIIELNREMLGE